MNRMEQVLLDNTYTYEQISSVASILISALGRLHCIAFSGDLGAGKTTLISTICKELGYNGRVSSPTFALINEYNAESMTIYHMDWYRFSNSMDALNAGVGDILERAELGEALCLIEWPERATDLLPDNYLSVNLSHINEQVRGIQVVKISRH